MKVHLNVFINVKNTKGIYFIVEFIYIVNLSLSCCKSILKVDVYLINWALVRTPLANAIKTYLNFLLKFSNFLLQPKHLAKTQTLTFPVF